MVLILIFAAVTIVTGSLLLYLASPNQVLFGRRFPARLCSTIGALFLIVALVLLLQFSGPGSSAFILVTGVMLVWTIPPMVFAFFRHKREVRS